MIKRFIIQNWERVLVRSKRLIQRIVDHTLTKPTFNLSKSTQEYSFNENSLQTLKITNNNFQYLNAVNNKELKYYLKHEFNLLGSNRIKIGYWTKKPKTKNLKYFFLQSNDKIKNIKSNICSALNIDIKELINYEPIDWHIDFISGFRWSEKNWYMDVPIGKHLGTDIKVPWELSRLQHLPQLALSYSEDSSQEYLAKECVLQITDWIVSNRLRFGVNWRTSMEVAIRACNMLLTYELIKKSNFITPEFNEIFEKSLFEHGNHIKNNLESYYFFHGHNHYMANIVGLIFLGISTNNKHSTQWLKFGIDEFNKAIDFQLYEDGGHFEGSAYYHRLVLEMVLHTFILISNNEKEVKKIIGKEEILSKKTLQKVHNAFLFFKYIITPNYSLYQFGDNDSGRLFNLTGHDDENINKFITDLGEKYFYNKKSKTHISNLFFNKTDDVKQDSISNNLIDTFKLNFKSNYFPDSNIYVFKNNLYSSLVVLRRTTLGHTHNDLFSFELYAFGKPFIIDGAEAID